jgi:hypothetical protein
MKLLPHTRSVVSIAGNFLLLFWGFPSAGPAIQLDSTVRLNDNSDWWSSNSVRDGGDSVRTQERVPADTNYEILGIDLTDNVFHDATSKLGKPVIVERENAASIRRRQICYASDDDAGKVHLVFEQGAFPFGVGFYLFTDGASWTGSDMCLSSKLLSITASTGSGLHLGQTPSEVMLILGRPSRRRRNELIYAFHARKRRSAEELKKLRQVNSQLSDQEFHDKYDSYDLEPTVDARFLDSKLTYLAVSRAELN